MQGQSDQGTVDHCLLELSRDEVKSKQFYIYNKKKTEFHAVWNIFTVQYRIKQKE